MHVHMFDLWHNVNKWASIYNVHGVQFEHLIEDNSPSPFLLSLSLSLSISLSLSLLCLVFT